MSNLMTESRSALATPEAIREFVLAGDAIFTLHSRKTDAHYTYRVRRAEAVPGKALPSLWFVQLLTGPDNTNDYSYLGCLRANAPDGVSNIDFRITKKSRLPLEATPIKALRFMWRAVHERNEYPPDMMVYHEGKCGRCGRTLTVPESLERGIGPECAKHVGMSGGRGLKLVRALAAVMPEPDCLVLDHPAITIDSDRTYGCEISDLRLDTAPLAFMHDGRKFEFHHVDKQEDEIVGWWYRSTDERAFLLIND